MNDKSVSAPLPPLLQKMLEIQIGELVMLEIQIGELVVRHNRIIEPRTGCRIASGFPSRQAAIAAAMAMNEVADWFGIIKTRAQGLRPNCQAELQHIAERHGGKLGVEAAAGSERRCADVVAKSESAACGNDRSDWIC